MGTYLSRNRRAGFTIVELLIVIVVIGILAAITIVAYSGITSRAIAAQYASAAANFQKVIMATHAETSTVPFTATPVCLGNNASDYPVESTFSAGVCHGSAGYTYSQTIVDGLNTANVKVPSGRLPVVNFSNSTENYNMRGILYLSTIQNYVVLIWTVPVKNACGPGVETYAAETSSRNGICSLTIDLR